MKKTLLTAVCVAVLMVGSISVQAAKKEVLPPPPHEMDYPGHRPEHKGKEFGRHERGKNFDVEKHHKMADKFAKKLGLTEEQKAKADKIRKAGHEKVKPLMKQMDELREKMDKLREENMKEFESILTPEQKAKLDKIKAERKDFHDKKKMDKKMKKHEKKAEHKK